MTWHAIIQLNLIALVSTYSLSLNSDRYSSSWVRVSVRVRSLVQVLVNAVFVLFRLEPAEAGLG